MATPPMDYTAKGTGKPSSHSPLASSQEKSQCVKQNTPVTKEAKRSLSVSYEEMNRLMDTYGPLKAKRNHSTSATGRETKPESMRRKFYRWFPDFNERFVKGSTGMFVPKAGHQQELEYRETMRQMDQRALAKKRNDKRYSFGSSGSNA